jgi:arginine N-succinyltransferase
MGFQEADAFNGAHGTRFIADLMPKTPIYTAMLSESARSIMAVPHPSGKAAMRMLEDEGFEGGGYIDIFDGGPTMSVDTDDIRTIRESRKRAFTGAGDEGERKMVAAGHLKAFAACYGRVAKSEDGATLDEKAAQMLGLEKGGSFLSISR